MRRFAGACRFIFNKALALQNENPEAGNKLVPYVKRAVFPNFKKCEKNGGFRYRQSMKLEQHNSWIFLPKLGWIRHRNSRDVVGTIKNITISCTNGKGYVSIEKEIEVPEPAHSSTSIAGLSVGVAWSATLSNGTLSTY
jgi:putative transposase